MKRFIPFLGFFLLTGCDGRKGPTGPIVSGGSLEDASLNSNLW